MKNITVREFQDSIDILEDCKNQCNLQYSLNVQCNIRETLKAKMGIHLLDRIERQLFDHFRITFYKSSNTEMKNKVVFILISFAPGEEKTTAIHDVYSDREYASEMLEIFNNDNFWGKYRNEILRMVVK